MSISDVKVMQINDQKAGMQGLDKDMINKVIYEASKGTSYFSFQQKRQERIDKRVKEMLMELENVKETQRKEALERMDALCVSLEAQRDLSHSIVHIDMDAFYAAVEMLDNPDLKDKPMAVGSLSMLSTSNYCARKYGVRAAMPGFIAKKLCPDLVILPCNFEKYRKVSHQIRDIIKEYDKNYSAASLDEVYFDLTDYIMKKYCQKSVSKCDPSVNESSSDESKDDDDEFVCSQSKKLCSRAVLSDNERDDLAYEIVQEIRNKIHEATCLTSSAGIAPNTMLAKVCSDQNKPNGQFQIRSSIEEVKKFVSTLPVKKISGIGPVQGQVLNALGIYTCSDLLAKRDLVDILFTPTSSHFYIRVALGLGSTSVKSDYIRKSIGLEETFREISKPEDLHQKCIDLCEEAVEDLKSHRLLGKVVVLKVKTVKFSTHTRNFSLPFHTSDKDIITSAARKLLDSEIKAVAPELLRLRLMGIRLANVVDESLEINGAKQTNIKEFLQSKSSSISKNVQDETTSSSNTFICPVCKAELQLTLKEFDHHVDSCSNEHRSSDMKMNGMQTVQKDTALLKVPPDKNLLFSYLESSSKYAQKNNAHCVDGDKNITDQVNDVNLCNSDQESVSNVVVCPICHVEKKSGGLEALNKHIDSCLSRSTIKEILSNEASTNISQEKRKSPLKKQKSKKLRKESCTLRKIDDYFQ